MLTVTVCGSMRFSEEMKSAAFALESQKGYNVLQCTYNDRGEEITPEMRENLKKAHFEKIKMSDIVYVVDCGGYIGESVQKEIAYAESLRKRIVFHSSGVI